jgi:hypothetical protein
MPISVTVTFVGVTCSGLSGLSAMTVPIGSQKGIVQSVLRPTRSV